MKLALFGFVLGLFWVRFGFDWVCIGFVLGLFWLCFHQVSNWIYFHNPLRQISFRSFWRCGNWLCFAQQVILSRRAGLHSRFLHCRDPVFGMVQSWVAASSAGLRLSSAECPWGWQSSKSGATIPKSFGFEAATRYGATNQCYPGSDLFEPCRNYCYLPLYIFCGEHLLCARLREFSESSLRMPVLFFLKVQSSLRAFCACFHAFL